MGWSWAGEAIYTRHVELKDQFRFPDTNSTCGIPAGFPRVFNLPDPYEFVVRPEEVWILTENGPNVARIYTDGRPHLEEPWGTYTGDSVGHWEDDTLVFTTIGLKGWRDEDVILDRSGLVISDAARVTTRMRKTNDTTIEVQMIIEDSKALTAPWAVTKTFGKMDRGRCDVRDPELTEWCRALRQTPPPRMSEQGERTERDRSRGTWRVCGGC